MHIAVPTFDKIDTIQLTDKISMKSLKECLEDHNIEYYDSKSDEYFVFKNFFHKWEIINKSDWFLYYPNHFYKIISDLEFKKCFLYIP